ncbi:MAG: S1 RNA-binding domain-containing protein, partial [Phycisphaeraceae bacterium]
MSESQPNPPHQPRPANLDDEQLQREVDEALEGQSVEDLMQQSEQAEQSAQNQSAQDQSAPDQPAPTDQADSQTANQVDNQTGDAASAPTEEPPEFHHDVRRGRISAIRGDDVFVDLVGVDGKMQGIVPLSQFERSPRIGSIMDFVVERTDEAQGLIYLSREGAVSRATWQQLKPGAIIEARVVATNKGGLELEMVGGIRAFMPASQIDIHHVDDLKSMIGQKLDGLVQEIHRRSKKVVLSRRAVIEQRQRRARMKLLAEIEEGQIREGKISSVVDFGAFVDLGGLDGLIHVSDLSYTHIDKPADVVTPGQDVHVKVLKIDREKERISLGLKQVQPDPWEGIEHRYQAGSQVPGKVTRTANFGAFVELEPGIEALLPLSEMSWRRITKAEQVVQQGDNIRAAVLNVDPAKRRISLSLKQAQGDPWVGTERKYEKGSVQPGKVLSTTDFGAFIELEPGVEGLVHISELSQQRVGQVTDVLKPGDENKFRVLEVDEENHKIRLSLKQVEHP